MPLHVHFIEGQASWIKVSSPLARPRLDLYWYPRTVRGSPLSSDSIAAKTIAHAKDLGKRHS